jgi:hypothetical protein
MKKIIINVRCIVLVLALALPGCEEFVQVDLPNSQISSDAVFTNDNTALAAANGMYQSMLGTQSLIGGSFNSMAYVGGLSSDELVDYTGRAPYNEFYHNQLSSANSAIRDIWSSAYSTLYRANAVVEGSTTATSLSESLRNQLIGEGLFVRALCHFYLVNLFGDIPLVVTTDYRQNSAQGRTPVVDVYNQIVNDLTEAKNFLTEDYYTSQRTRPNKFAAAALLARVYLYMKDYQNSENEATYVINASSKYSLLTDLSIVFLSNSGEAIWQLGQVYPDGFPTADGQIFPIFEDYYPTALSSDLVNSFEPNDLRESNWVSSVSTDVGTLYRAYKYKKRFYFTDSAYPEQLVVIRLAELYLIRSEDRVMMENTLDSQQDLNAIRNRAGLPNTTAAEKSTILQAILDERRHELFCEFGHRWLDLKRTSEANSVLSTPKSDWTTDDQLYPIPATEITINSRLNPQNPGY